MSTTLGAGRPRRPTARRAVPERRHARIVIEGVTPTVDGGRFAPKRTERDMCEVGADIFRDGQDLLKTCVRWRRADGSEGSAPLAYDADNDRWLGAFALDTPGVWAFRIEAWTDVFGTWLEGLSRNAGAGHDVALELREGAELASRAARATRAREPRSALTEFAARLADTTMPQEARVQAARRPELAELLERHLPQDDLTRSAEFPLLVERERAAVGAWYEMFPRSATDDPARHGTFADAERALPRIAALGFDVVYLPPIHPIGRTHRKGPNNSLHAGPADVGSPWAIGSEEGGHDAVHPQLGTIASFDRFVASAGRLGLEVALDYALQCSPDHPWVREHPDWFRTRPDGSIQYAENPPKKYQDIYPLDFWCEDREALWAACRDILLFWIGHGVRIFRVDNPHTKAFSFWEWCLDELTREHPDLIFLSESFTRPKVMKELARIGFTQSYTYFAWRDQKWELEEYYAELHLTEVGDYFRPNSWPNTPDILTEFLQHGGRPAFVQKLILAATLTANYGIYGPPFELMEHVARPGAEEYLDNEKYELRHWDLDAPHSLAELIARVNTIRREHPALQQDRSFALHHVDNEALLATSKRDPLTGDTVLTIVNLDTEWKQGGFTWLDLEALGIEREDERFEVYDALGESRYVWQGRRNFVELDPHVSSGHIFVVRRLDAPSSAHQDQEVDA